MISLEQSGPDASALPLSLKSPQPAKVDPTLVPGAPISQDKNQVRIKMWRGHPLWTGRRCIISRQAAGMDSELIFGSRATPDIPLMAIFRRCQPRYERSSGHFPWLAPRRGMAFWMQIPVDGFGTTSQVGPRAPVVLRSNATHGRDQSPADDQGKKGAILSSSPSTRSQR